MGLIQGLTQGLAGTLLGNRNVIAETAQVFRENAEAAGVREAGLREAVLAQYAAEFQQPRQAFFDRFVDGLNRLPRPALAFGTLGLFGAAMADPVWFSSRMQGLALVPEPLWWLMGAIVSFYFGARYQAHGQAFQRSIAETMARVPQVAANVASLQTAPPAPMPAQTGGDARLTLSAETLGENAALAEWQHQSRPAQ